MQQPEIKTIPEKIIIGLHEAMSLSDDKTMKLWRTFGPRKKEIVDASCLGSYSIQIYDERFMKGEFSPATLFDKWAGMEVKNTLEVPEGMEVLIIAAGTWAVFQYQGVTSEFYKMAQYIYQEWLPNSGYQLDNRPHFEYMAPDYLGAMHPEAREEVWIPIR